MNVLAERKKQIWPSRLGLKNTRIASLQRDKTSPTSALDIIQSSLMVRLQ